MAKTGLLYIRVYGIKCRLHQC